jgi:hypothetical protein
MYCHPLKRPTFCLRFRIFERDSQPPECEGVFRGLLGVRWVAVIEEVGTDLPPLLIIFVSLLYNGPALRRKPVIWSKAPHN